MRPKPAFAAAIRWIRDRRDRTRPREQLFVGRSGVFGPELYLVGRRVRRLPAPPTPDALAVARQVLAEVMRCRPATQLARRFADASLEPLDPDGFVLSRLDVEAWLDDRPGRLEPAESGDPPHAGR